MGAAERWLFYFAVIAVPGWATLAVCAAFALPVWIAAFVSLVIAVSLVAITVRRCV